MSVDTSHIANRRGIKKIVKLDDAVVVVADRFWRARDAAAALDPVFDNDARGSVNSAIITARRIAALNGGDLKSGYEDRIRRRCADEPGRRSYEAIYQVPYLAHAPMEPMNATALYKNGTLEVWAGTQDGLGARALLRQGGEASAGEGDLSPAADGRRLRTQAAAAMEFLDYAVQTAMAMPGVPVKLLFTREQDMQHDYYRPNVMSRMRAAFAVNNAPLAWSHDYTTNDGPNPAADKGANPQAHIAYGIPNQEYRTVAVPTHIPTGPWRSVEASWHGFFVESFIDELAHEAKADPFAYRAALLGAKPRHLAVLKKAAQAAGWGTPLPAGQARGIALFESFESIVAHVAEVEVSPEGVLKVRRVVAAIDCGMAVNPDGLKAQIEGGIVFGLSAALHGAITIDKGAVMQANFPDYEMVRMAECPEIEVHIVESGAPLGGAGEPGVPPVAPAVTNAIFAATGVRIRALPIANQRLTPPTARSAAAG